MMRVVYVSPVFPKAKKFVVDVIRLESIQKSEARIFVENENGELEKIGMKKAKDTYSALLALCNETNHWSWLHSKNRSYAQT